jgi:2-desacetyl-2-hydroxyethyl bacteriochlorophyllide A dehydrogenase
MKALVLEGPHQAVIKEVPYPVPGPGEVTIKVENVGICGTDFHLFAGENVVPYPVILGHEFSGTIYEIGEGVASWQPGDRVSADPSIYCGACEFCLTHRANHCENFKGLGTMLNGSMAEYVAVPARNVVRLPDTMSFEEGAFIEPMACVVYGMNRLQLQVGNRVILFGAGAMGQQLIQSIARAGASELVVVDVSQKKLDLALEWGATKGVLSQELDTVLSWDQYPHGFDVVVDVTGIPAVIEKAFEYMGRMSKFLQFGVTPEDSSIRIDPFKVYRNDWTIIGSNAINYTFLSAFQWLKEGRIDVKRLVSKVISLEETVGFLANPKDPDLFKVQIKI